MLSTIKHALGIKNTLEKEAAAIWADGQMLVDWRTPSMGTSWDEKYYPFWRKWAGEKPNERETTYYQTYASIEDEIFWQRAGLHFQPGDFLAAVGDAGRRGNLVVFHTLPEEYVRAFAQLYVVPRTKEGPRELVHPDVVTFLRDKGYWGQPEVDAMASDYRFLNKKTSNIQHFDGDGRGICTSEFARDWCLKALRDYRWSADKQAQFLGNMMMTFNGGIWKDNIDVLKPVLHPDVDVGLLAGVCGMQAEYFDEGATFDGAARFYDTVQQVSQHGRLYLWAASIASRAQGDELVIRDGHLGLSLMLEMVPAKEPMDLYRCALQVKRRELGLETIETLVLPELNF